jgi:L-cysteine:1D-myo-inositol 2-amino-2-deoxy-alpha-D-glucopyranoside ligase
MKLFDTRSGDMRELIAGHTVRMYVCGITPYDATHLGHAFTYVAFDVLIRALERRGHRVRHVRNVTDVDDDILRAARERGVDYLELAATETTRFDQDMLALGCRPPDVAPRATESVDAIVTAVRGLLARGSAYVLDDGRVYFDVARAPTFGDLSGLDRDEMLRQFAEKGGDPEAGDKRDALVDLHGGGMDLVFPHHEAEIQQSEHLTGQGPFARFWLHTGMVGLDGEKMSKSSGNLVFVRDLLDRVEGPVVRTYLLSHHYRSTWSHHDDELQQSCDRRKRWHAAAAIGGRDEAVEAACWEALANDLDTPRVLELMDGLASGRHGASLRAVAAVMGIDLTPT